MFIRVFQLIITKLVIIAILSSPIKVLDKGILPLEKNSVGIQFFLDFENVDKMYPCKIYAHPHKCCLNKDCDSMKLYGENLDTLKPNDRKTYLYVYPTLIQLNQQGLCYFLLQYQCGKRMSKSKDIKIPFDTRYKKRASNNYLLKTFNGQKLTQCKGIDGDPLNNCKPVNCDKKYAGGKPFYDRNASLCVEAPECLSKPNQILPDRAYEPHSNTCKDLEHALTVTEIYLLNSGIGIIKAPLYDEETKIIYKHNCSSVSQNVYFLKDMLFGNLCSLNRFKIDYTESCNNAIMSILSCVIGVSSLLILFICCATTMVWVKEQWKLGNLHGTVTGLKSRIIAGNVNCEEKQSKVNIDLKNKLIKEVIVSDLPLELQDSMIDICERIGKDVRWKRRFRMMDVDSRINLKHSIESDTSTTSNLDVCEKERLLKK